MGSRKTRLSWPGFALSVAVLLAVSARAGDLKPARSFTVTFPPIYQTPAFGPFGLQYISPKQLAFWFTDHEQGELSTRDQVRDTDPSRLKVQLLNDKGKVTRRAEWPTHSASTALLVSQGGRITLITGPIIRCVLPDLTQIGSTRLFDHVSRREYRTLIPSPGGSSVWAVTVGEELNLTRIDPPTCQTMNSVTTPPTVANITANDSKVIASNRTVFGYATASGWKGFYESTECCITRAAFVTQDIVVAFRELGPDSRSLLAFDLDGKTLLDQPIEPGYAGSRIVPSIDGRVLGIVEASLGQFPTVPAEVPPSYRVHLYELPSFIEMGTFEVETNGHRFANFAISPDDAHMAVLIGSRVSIYAIPRHPQPKKRASKRPGGR